MLTTVYKTKELAEKVLEITNQFYETTSYFFEILRLSWRSYSPRLTMIAGSIRHLKNTNAKPTAPVTIIQNRRSPILAIATTASESLSSLSSIRLNRSLDIEISSIRGFFGALGH